MIQLHFDLSKKKRDQGIHLVTENNEEWIDCALSYLYQAQSLLPKEFTSDDIRDLIVPWTGNPKHKNSWGALMSICVSRKMFVFTERVRNSSRPASHARCLKIYRWT